MSASSRVQYQQPRPAQQRTGKAETLSLATGEPHALGVDEPVEPALQRARQIVRADRFQRLPDFFITDRAAAPTQVVAQAVIEQEWLLSDIGERGPQPTCKPTARSHRVDFPAPDSPIRAVTCPAGIRADTRLMTGGTPASPP